MELMLTRSSVEGCLYNFLGYGNLNGNYWFIGTEEGGAEIWREGIQKLEVAESLDLRRTYKPAMEFREVWEDKYGIPLEEFKGPTVWRYIAAFLLYIEDEIHIESSREEIRNKVQEYLFVRKRLGTFEGNHFLCELFPLPKKSRNNMDPYSSIWQNIKLYHEDVLPGRLDLIFKTIELNKGVRNLITYEQVVWDRLSTHFPIGFQKTFRLKSGRSWELSTLLIENERRLCLVRTPFFGQGRISFSDLGEIAKDIKVFGT